MSPFGFIHVCFINMGALKLEAELQKKERDRAERERVRENHLFTVSHYKWL